MENFGKYIIEKQIGEGGTASVYLAKDTILKRSVALKIMSNQQFSVAIDFRKLLMDEAQRTANLNHPNIIQIYEVGTIDNNIFIAMEYLSGGTLKDLIYQKVDFNPLKIITDIAKALNYAYSETSTIHRDIKPANIIFRQHSNGEADAVLTDFGISKTEGTDSDFTSFDVKVGTPRYMSPEQLLGASVDQRSDLYSLGIVFYEMLVGEKPFDNQDTVATTLNSITNKTPKLPPEFKQYQPILNKLITPHPNDRFNTAEELLSALGNFKKTSKQLSLPWLAASIFGVSLTVGGIYVFYTNNTSSNEKPPSPKEATSIQQPPPSSAPPLVEDKTLAETTTTTVTKKPKNLEKQQKVKADLDKKLLLEKQKTAWEENLTMAEKLLKKEELKKAKDIIDELTIHKLPEEIQTRSNNILERIISAKKLKKALERLGNIQVKADKKEARAGVTELSAQTKVTIKTSTPAYIHCLYQSPPPEDKKMMRISPPPKKLISYNKSLTKYKIYKKRTYIQIPIGEGLSGTANIYCFSTLKSIEKDYNSLFKPDSNGFPYTRDNITLREIKKSMHDFSEGVYSYSSTSILFSH